MDFFFLNLQRHICLDKTGPWLGFGDLDPIFRVTGEFSLNICLQPVDVFHLK